MLSIRRKAVQSAGRLPTATNQISKRFASVEHAKTGGDAHSNHDHGHDHGHHHGGPKEESLGTYFYVTLAALPISIGVYTLSQPSADGKLPGISNFINSWSYYKDKWAARNTLHTVMIEQAAFDRNLFHSNPGNKHVDLKFPEIFNTGSPYNVSAGQGPKNMDQLIAHYEKLNSDDEERKLKALEKKS